MKYKDIAKATQDLLGGASMSTGRQNAIVLREVHAFLDGIQSGDLVVSAPVKDPEPPPENPAK